MRYKGSGVVLRHQRQSLMVHDNDAKGSTATKDTLFGDEVYVADSMAVRARGFAISAERLKELRDKRLRDILSDGKGREDVAVLFGGLELTAFGTETVTQILQPPWKKSTRTGGAKVKLWPRLGLSTRRHASFLGRSIVTCDTQEPVYLDRNLSGSFVTPVAIASHLHR